MAISYTYPRVTVDVEARRHSSVQPGAEDTTVLFVPLITEKGPDKTVTPVHTLNEFVSVFGNLDYEVNGQMALNVYNWLINGGTVYVYRITNAGVADIYSDLVKTALAHGGVEIDTRADGQQIEDLTASKFYLDKGLLTYLGTDGIIEDWEKGKFFQSTTQVLVETEPAEDSGEEEPGEEAEPAEPVYETVPYYGFKINNEETDRQCYDDNVKVYVTTAGTNPVFDPDEEHTIQATATVRSATPDTVTVQEGEVDYGNVVIVSWKYASAEGTTEAPESIGKAKYSGEYYSNMTITITPISDRYFNMTVRVRDLTTGVNNIVEQFYRLTADSYKSALVASEYIGELELFDDAGLPVFTEEYEVVDDVVNFTPRSDNKRAYNSVDLSCGVVTVLYETDLDALHAFWTEEASNLENSPLLNELETPIDIMLDAGYPAKIKADMATFVKDVRPDIVLLLDAVELKGRLSTPNLDPANLENVDEYAGTKVAIWDQYFTVYDATFTGQNIFVAPSYFLSRLIPYNDLTYGIQFATAGLRRGVLEDALAVNENPTPDKKQDNFLARINYCEKSSREYAFMCQRMYDGSTDAQYTALSMLNNTRVVERMKKDIKRIGRQYLFEFNDNVTLANLQTVLNRYVTNWIANRTLATGTVTVRPNPFSEEAVDVSLVIKFNGTIEVIAVDITIE